MDSHRLVEAQFDRAVEIVQGLPKTGPIQTGYEEKLTMYSLYKQATVGNVKTPRPGIWDMLGRAKWDEWAKHKDLDQYDAKLLYVDALLKVLRKYSDRTIARDLVRELESYGGDPSNIVLTHTLTKSPNSASSGSTSSEDQATLPSYSLITPPYNLQTGMPKAGPAEELTSEEETDDQARNFQVVQEPTQSRRPQSSRSSHRYRTPMAGSLAMSPPAPHEQMSVPPTQPHPGFETPSAFGETSSMPSSLFPTTSSYVGQYSESSRAEVLPRQHIFDPRYRHAHPVSPQQYGPALQPTLEHAVERIQGHLAALTERLESLENNARHSSVSLATGGTTPNWGGAGRGSPAGRSDRSEWDLDDLGMWSLVLNPLARGISSLRMFATFLARSENKSPVFIVIRRLFLDVSFLFCAMALARAIWRRSGVRRREVRAALRILWHALLGSKKERVLVDRGVGNP